MPRIRPPRAGIADEHVAAWTKGSCRWCLGAVAPPRRTFCSDACVHEWKLRTDPGYLRQKVFERDRGVCAACSRDCQALGDRLVRLLYENPSQLDAELARLKMTRRSYGALDHRLPVHARGRMGDPVDPDLEVWEPVGRGRSHSLWEADHIVEVADGGGSCDLANIQTLCRWCHRAKSAASRVAREARKREVRPPDDLFDHVPRPPDELFDPDP